MTWADRNLEHYYIQKLFQIYSAQTFPLDVIQSGFINTEGSCLMRLLVLEKIRISQIGQK
jgi:hypothetical protein